MSELARYNAKYKINASIEGLFDYINSQPSDKPINHATWGHCVIGEYLRTMDVFNVGNDSHNNRACYLFSALIDGEPASIVISLSNVIHGCGTLKETKVYGDVQSNILDYLRESA